MGVFLFAVRAALFAIGGLALLAMVALIRDGWGSDFWMIALIVGALFIFWGAIFPLEDEHGFAAFGCACVIVAGVGVLAVTGGLEKGCGDFDAEDFRDSDPYERADDGKLLWECEILQGMSREETIELLGPATRRNPRGLAWLVGNDFIDDLFVAVRFDARDRVDGVFRQQIG